MKKPTIILLNDNHRDQVLIRLEEIKNSLDDKFHCGGQRQRLMTEVEIITDRWRSLQGNFLTIK